MIEFDEILSEKIVNSKMNYSDICNLFKIIVHSAPMYDEFELKANYQQYFKNFVSVYSSYKDGCCFIYREIENSDRRYFVIFANHTKEYMHKILKMKAFL
jgi:hypothetical protein